jgi:DNA-binding transcriptional regulator GbsR (MarR family)
MNPTMQVVKRQEEDRKKTLTSSATNCIFCNNRNNRHDETNKKDAKYGRAKMSVPTKNSLTPVAQKFILHWGEMGTRWGINRTVAQVHALLFLSPQPLPADEISETLAVARSNVSTSLRELQGWRIVRVVHVLGDRRDHFESIKDVWEIFRIVSEERKRREIDPTLNVLAECVREVKSNPQGDAYTRERLETMLEFLTAMTGLFEEIIRMPTGALKGVVKLRGKVITLLGKKAVNS